jgi:hypothetical protein
MSQPKNISDHLRPESGPLKDLLAHAKHLDMLNNELANCLGGTVSPHCRLANVNGTTVVLHADSPVWSARLRYLLPQVLKCLNQHHPEANLTRVDVRVKLPERT